MVNFTTGDRKRCLAPSPSGRSSAGLKRKPVVEALEHRWMLSAVSEYVDVSADLPDDAGLVAEVSTEQRESKASPAAARAGGNQVQAASQALDLSIVGTAIQFDSVTGLPASMEGDVYFVGGFRDGEVAGKYTEELTPIIHPEVGFVGTTGVSVFSFFAPSQNGSRLVGELTTWNQSWIVGVDMSSGAILVQSTGEFVGGTGAFRNVEGGFSSSSTVFLPNPTYGIQFALNVNLSIEFETMPQRSSYVALGFVPGAQDRVDSALSGLANRSAGQQIQIDQASGPAALLAVHGQGRHRHDPCHLAEERGAGSRGRNVEVLDRVFADLSRDGLREEVCLAAKVGPGQKSAARGGKTV